ncbi:2-acylglycerol O-acyltransferase 2-A-like isoform X1 [Topomyia yanbarensis]|uniref:2-acylglycerol O-acyltransferase 2-A-like isoform X1 n=1 Tax=Topomyia yanbarensis TaxID=2498891 RepID=UPI00273BF246|nr:2-acylglycerol O-acyltransferase 2-A-like isoform X1 [Topomyia yanbarensis]
MRQIEWAPLNVPLRRRLETLSAFCIMSLFLFGELWLLFYYLYLLVFGGLLAKTFCVIYGIFVYFDRDAGSNCGRGQGLKWFRNIWLVRLFQSYFPAKLHKTVDLPADRNYIFAAFPHGVLSTGCFLSFATDTTGFSQKFPAIRSRIVTLNFHLLVPFFRELVLSWGAVSCSEQSITNLLQASTDPSDASNSDGYTSNAVVIIVGGAAESLNCRPNNYQLVLKKRKGFCRIALQTGTPIVPVINFGELDLYDQPANPPGSRLRRFQEWVKATTGIAPAALIGRGFFQYTIGVIPRRKPINTVVGAPVQVTKLVNPSKEDVECLHEKFCAALEDLFETHKSKYIENFDNVRLVLE